MSAAAQSLWPEPPEQRIRPLRLREEPTAGQRIYVEGVARVWRWHYWMTCGRYRLAVLLCDDPTCHSGHVFAEEGVRVDA